MIGSNYYIVLMVLGPLLGVFGTMVTQRAQAAISKRTTAGTVQTSNAGELWQENARLVDRLTKEIDRITADVDHVREELRRMRVERDDALTASAGMRERIHELELELQRLKYGQAANAVTTVRVESNAPGASDA